MKLSLRISAAALTAALLIITANHNRLNWQSAAQSQESQGGIRIGKGKATPPPTKKPPATPARKPATLRPRTPVASVLNIPRATWPEFVTITLDRYGRLVKQETKRANYFTEDLGNGVKLEMVEIPSGSFTMGSPSNEASRDTDEGPPHPVTVSSFWMGKFEVTQKQWLAVMGKFTNDPGFRGDDLPVERVSWKDAQEFLKTLNDRPNLQGKGYRLPTEAEWEYAARAGTTTPFAFGETITTKYVNFNYDLKKTTPVGSFGVANAFGLFDMHGNVWEWCQDVYLESYSNTPRDGSAYLSGGDSSSRVLRGGSWSYLGYDCRSANRLRGAPGDVTYSLGFRVVSARTP